MNKSHLAIIKDNLEKSIKYKKCWRCGCQQGTIGALSQRTDSLDEEERTTLSPLLKQAESTFVPVEYDCLECKVCFPSVVSNKLLELHPDLEITENCSTESVDASPRNGYPPFAGNYKLGRFQGSVAVCTLNSKDLIDKISERQHSAVAIVGSLNTENLGIERVIQNVLANSNIRFLILCGKDSEQTIGHLPGQSFLSFAQYGIDDRMRIINAKGKRPILKNISPDAASHFRKQVEVIDLINQDSIDDIFRAVESRAASSVVPIEAYQNTVAVKRIDAKISKPLVLDKSGYFVIYPDRQSQKITVEHYENSGTLDVIIEGKNSEDIYMTIIDFGLIGKLDHACYLGKELARAEFSLFGEYSYEQDKAQDISSNNETKNIRRCDTNCC